PGRRRVQPPHFWGSRARDRGGKRVRAHPFRARSRPTRAREATRGVRAQTRAWRSATRDGRSAFDIRYAGSLSVSSGLARPADLFAPPKYDPRMERRHARYPFLDGAREAVANLYPDLHSLAEDETVLARAVERSEGALTESDIGD